MLANPTRYHVIQKQKNQVRQYLSESFQQHCSANDAATTSGGGAATASGWDAAGSSSQQSLSSDQTADYVSVRLF